MEAFRIGVVQMNALRGDLDHNLAVHERLARDMANDGCQLVMFPELSVTAHYGADDVTALAEAADYGRIYKTICALARDLNLIIGYGFCERAHGTFYNSYALISPDGPVGVQRKVHASLDEYLSFRMGCRFEVFNLGFCRAGVLICFDASFFEAWRVMALNGADVLLLPHAARSGMGVELSEAEQQTHLEKVLAGLPGRYGIYADDNNVFAVCGNQVGYNGHSTHSGSAYVCGPDGKLVARSEPRLDDLWVKADLDPALLDAQRNSKYSLLRTRRPETYRDLSNYCDSRD